MNGKRSLLLRIMAVGSMLSAFSFKAVQQTPTEMVSINGVILSADTGNTLSGVQITGSPIHNLLLSENSGAFQIDDVDPGLVLLTFQKQGFVEQSIPFTFSAGQSVKGIN